MKTNAEWMAEEISKTLVGGRITNALVTDEDQYGTAFYGFRVEVNGGAFNVWVQRDPEGNGEGFLAIEEGR